LKQYCDELEEFRIHELDQVTAAVRRGLLTQLSPIVLMLSKWSDLERLVCGNTLIDVALLRSMTRYSSYSESDREIAWFWEIMNELSQEDLKAYLVFTWGRSRLPLSAADFGDKRMVIERCSGNALALPSSHTCSFQLDLPRYQYVLLLPPSLQLYSH
jgi:hypothetical protein